MTSLNELHDSQNIVYKDDKVIFIEQNKKYTEDVYWENHDNTLHDVKTDMYYDFVRDDVYKDKFVQVYINTSFYGSKKCIDHSYKIIEEGK